MSVQNVADAGSVAGHVDDPGGGPVVKVPVVFGALSPRDCRALGYSRDEVEVVDAVIPACKAAGGVPASVVSSVMAPAVAEGEEVLIIGSQAVLDPHLDQTEEALNAAAGSAGQVGAWTQRTVVSGDDGARMTLPDAYDKVDDDSKVMADDAEKGARHHHRIDPFVRSLSNWAPWFDIPAMLLIVAVALNVNIVRFWENPLGVITVVFVVCAVVWAQLHTTTKAAEGVNQAREAEWEKRYRDAEAARRSAWRWGAAAIAITGALALLLVYRVWTMASLTTGGVGAWLMVALAVAAAVATPLLRFIAVSADGSTYSRRVDDLNGQLDAHEQDRLDLLAEAGADLAYVEDAISAYYLVLRRDVIDDAHAVLAQRGHRLVQLLVLQCGQKTEPVEPVHGPTPDPMGRPAWPTFSTMGGLNYPTLAPIEARDQRMATIRTHAKDLKEALTKVANLPTRNPAPGEDG